MAGDRDVPGGAVPNYGSGNRKKKKGALRTAVDFSDQQSAENHWWK